MPAIAEATLCGMPGGQWWAFLSYDNLLGVLGSVQPVYYIVFRMYWELAVGSVGLHTSAARSVGESDLPARSTAAVLRDTTKKRDLCQVSRSA